MFHQLYQAVLLGLRRPVSIINAGDSAAPITGWSSNPGSIHSYGTADLNESSDNIFPKGKKNSKSSGYLIGFLAIVVFAFVSGCASTGPESESQKASTKQSNFSFSEDDFSYQSTRMLREYMESYGLGAHSESFELVATDINFTEYGKNVLFDGIFTTMVDGENWLPFTAAVLGFGSDKLEAAEELANHAVDIIGDPLIGYLSADGFDYETKYLGGYGFHLYSVVAYDKDGPLLGDWSSDPSKPAIIILQSVETELLKQQATGDTSNIPGEPVEIFQLMLFGTETSPDGKVTAKILKEGDGNEELELLLNKGVDWPEVKGTYSISTAYAIK